MPEVESNSESEARDGLFRSKTRGRWGDRDSLIKTFLGNSATLTIVILTLITIFLFKEGAGFASQYSQSLSQYRQSGIEYVDLMQERQSGYQRLARDLVGIRAAWIRELENQGLNQAEISATLRASKNDSLFSEYADSGNELRAFINRKMRQATQTRDQWLTDQNLRTSVSEILKRMCTVGAGEYTLNKEDIAAYVLLLRAKGEQPGLDPVQSEELMKQADTVQREQRMHLDDKTRFLKLLDEEANTLESRLSNISIEAANQTIRADEDSYKAIVNKQQETLKTITTAVDIRELERFGLGTQWAQFSLANEVYFAESEQHFQDLQAWDPSKRIPFFYALSNFLTGKLWVTASSQQDWFGLLPLLSGSLLISSIAVLLAVPFGVGSAIYVNQIAGPQERNWLKPYIEFVSAIPSVVIGFFGVIVFGEALRQLSQLSWLEWLPFFPMQERLNTFTAACLLALMAIPTIFTLAEEAINNIPQHLKEASFAMGATKLQTIFRVIVPGALSGIISAVMLGFGRVLGETMIVLLCAGNRIKLPDFTAGLGVLFEPTHTMTGIIAQEMGEVVRGSLHYQALFMVGIVLFFASLIINYGAQRVLKRYGAQRH